MVIDDIEDFRADGFTGIAKWDSLLNNDSGDSAVVVKRRTCKTLNAARRAAAMAQQMRVDSNRRPQGLSGVPLTLSLRNLLSSQYCAGSQKLFII